MNASITPDMLTKLLAVASFPSDTGDEANNAASSNSADFSLLLGSLLQYLDNTGSNSTTSMSSSLNPGGVSATQALWDQLSLNQSLNPINSKKQTTAASTTVSHSSASDNFTAIIHQAASKYGVDPSLIRSVMETESGGNKEAVSATGAQGLMQLMPATARALGVSNSFDPVQNIEGGTKYLKHLLNEFQGNTRLALAAYNAGSGSVRKYGGVPPYSETVAYVDKVMNKLNTYSV
ncbi:lytic transglycosylase domain-containing protein [Sporolactobacillus spathodeae]|uniref:Soluble lytic murein transglycosylase-like protein n=1 Tax=Sporolactobacillus spathodeae TaxID=1465502 RepID=A0ABS2Q4S0_9BACL|nr:lytic transglycosylase domain-containing protein [Sporolactobacillus spathodeae]MBM7656701.1 soluble lytic murein transglycosylase-like protein [Sporolactobacillus spathodeae]